MTQFDQNYLYDVALSFAGEDRNYAHALANILQSEGVKVFYDKYEKATLWGQDLYTYLSNIYQHQASYCVIFVSQHYATKLWTTHERKAAQARAFSEQRAYILPIRLDKTEIPGILPTVAHLNWYEETVESIAHFILEKLGGVSRNSKEEYLNESHDFYNKGYREKALIASEHAVRIDPYDSFVHDGKGTVLLGLKRYKEALASFERAIRLYRDDDDSYIYDIYCHKGQTLARLERYEEALETYEQAVKLDPGKDDRYRFSVSSALCSKGDIFCDLERYEEALAAYNEAIQLEMEQTYPSRYHISNAQCGKGNVLCNLKQYEGGLAEYEKAIHNDPKNVYGYNVKGRALSDLERSEEALTVFDQAIQLEPKHAYAYQYKAYILYCLRRYEEALIVCEQAIPLDREDADIYDTKGDILKALERHEEAEQAYVRASYLSTKSL